jgi:hypothetical protein
MILRRIDYWQSNQKGGCKNAHRGFSMGASVHGEDLRGFTDENIFARTAL